MNNDIPTPAPQSCAHPRQRSSRAASEGSPSRASLFAPGPDLGKQRPDRRWWFESGLAIATLFLLVEAWLLMLGASPERVFGPLFELAPPLSLGSELAPWVFIAIALLASTIGASYRPLGGLLGLGALPLPALVLVTDSASAAALCFAGSAASSIALRALSKRDPHAPKDRRGRHRMLADAAHTGIATLVAGTLWSLSAAGATLFAVAGSTAVWVLIGHLLDRRQRRSRTARRPATPLPRFGVLWDALGWLLGSTLALVAAQVGLISLLPLLIGYIALAGLGTARELDRTLHLRRIRDLQHLGSMAQRLVPHEQASELASQCLNEVHRTIDVSHFELRFESSTGREVFHSKGRGPLQTGEHTVPQHPPPAPGFHARREWILIERDLLSRPMATPKRSSGALPEPPQRLGVLRLWIDPRHLNDNDEELIDDLVPQIAALIDRSRLDREARLDALTGLARRHVFDRELERRFELARDQGHAVALLLFDLDHFKQINDGYGHDAGDRVLESIGAILSRAADPGGLACRWGGEEMALLLWGGGDNALIFADELRGFIETQSVATDSGVLSVTTSVGVAAFPDLLIQDPDELVKLADEALYAAKKHGRNRALVACGRGRFRGPDGGLVGATEPLDPKSIPQL